MNDKPRQIEDVDDDKLVDAIAAFGLKGLYLHDKPYRIFLASIGFTVFTPDERRVAMSRFSWYVETSFQGWPSLMDRLEWQNGTRVCLTKKEWSKRLAGKFAEDIEKILDGTNQ